MYRSLLSVPANDDKRLAGVHERGADAFILDPEDTVGYDAKSAARANIRQIADGLQARGAVVFVRINAP